MVDLKELNGWLEEDEIELNDWSELKNIPTYIWFRLLSDYPELETYCPFEKFTGYDILTWLSANRRPTAYVFDLNKLSSQEAYKLLLKRPEYAIVLADKIDSGSIAWLLKKHPQLADKFDLSRLNDWNWSFLEFHQPQLVEKYRK